MMKEFLIYDMNFCSLIERPLRRSVQGSEFCSTSYYTYLVTLSKAKGYSPFTIDHTHL